jgi:CBS domain-containing protein
MRVRNIMTPEPDVVTIAPADSVSKAVEHLVERGIGALPVIDGDGRPVGLVAERDIVRAVRNQPDALNELPVERIMHRPAPTCEIDEEIQPVMARMTHHRFRHLIVREDGRLAGMLSVGDLLKHRLDELEIEAAVLRDCLAAQRSRR